MSLSRLNVHISTSRHLSKRSSLLLDLLQARRFLWPQQPLAKFLCENPTVKGDARLDIGCRN